MQGVSFKKRKLNTFIKENHSQLVQKWKTWYNLEQKLNTYHHCIVFIKDEEEKKILLGNIYKNIQENNKLNIVISEKFQNLSYDYVFESFGSLKPFNSCKRAHILLQQEYIVCLNQLVKHLSPKITKNVAVNVLLPYLCFVAHQSWHHIYCKYLSFQTLCIPHWRTATTVDVDVKGNFENKKIKIRCLPIDLDENFCIQKETHEDHEDFLHYLAKK